MIILEQYHKMAYCAKNANAPAIFPEPKMQSLLKMPNRFGRKSGAFVCLRVSRDFLQNKK